MADTIPRRVTDILADDPDLSTFNNLLRRSKLIADVDTDDAFTIFAPTNAAFDAMPEGSIGELTGNEARLREVVAFHIAPGMYPEPELRELDEVATLADKEILVERLDWHTYVGGARIALADVAAENGFVHVIESVMIPD